MYGENGYVVYMSNIFLFGNRFSWISRKPGISVLGLPVNQFQEKRNIKFRSFSNNGQAVNVEIAGLMSELSN